MKFSRLASTVLLLAAPVTIFAGTIGWSLNTIAYTPPACSDTDADQGNNCGPAQTEGTSIR